MLGNLEQVAHIYIVCGYTDMRKSIDGLASIVKNTYELNPFSDSLFLFCGRRGDRLKALHWEQDGFLLLYKRLDGGKFQWPRKPEEVRTITRQEFRWLMEGAFPQPAKGNQGSKSKRFLVSKSTKYSYLCSLEMCTEKVRKVL